jgi:hypothetical protein
MLEYAVLQVALAAGITDGAVKRVMDQQELEVILPHFKKPVGMSPDSTFVDGHGGAGSHGIRISLHFHDAEPARAYGQKVLVKAERGYVDPILARSLKDRFPLFGLYLAAVNAEPYHCHLLKTTFNTRLYSDHADAKAA